jgi:flagellar export protein FliJ
MRFHFQLDGLLRLRRLLEREARERLDESLMRIHALQHSLSEAQHWSDETSQILAGKDTLPACELQFADSVLRQTKAAIRQRKRTKEVEEERAAELRQAYLVARRERKTVSTLRENALRQFQIEQARREQSALDEMFLGKLIHSRNAAGFLPESEDAKEAP